MASHRARRRVPPTTIRRLSAYFRVLSEQERQNAAAISSERLSELTGFTAAQVRRDLAYFGSFGKRGVGYAVTTLRGQLASILGIDRRWRVGLVGVGNLGKALLFYRGFADQGFEFVAAFDIDPAKIGTTLGALEVQPISNLAASAPGDRVDIVLVAVPADAAQSVVDGAVAAGVRAILNFAPVQLRVPPDVRLSNVDLSMEVEYLTYSLTT
jgi:redox-sensing transcriptional repressor